MSKTLHLGLFLMANGHHFGGWRHPQAEVTRHLDLQAYAEIARKAEAACLDMIFIADRLAVDDIYAGDFREAVRYRPSTSAEPITLIAALSALTRHIGLAATASTTYNEPFHVARMFASIDHLSGGRIAWNAVTSTSDGEAHNFSRSEHLERTSRYRRAGEFIQVVKGLWRSWGKDAVLADKLSGEFYDPQAVHYLDHQGEWFQVRGPLNVPSTPQGRPVVIQAGQSEDFRDLAASEADVIFTVQPTLAGAKDFYADLKARAQRAGRAPESLKIMPGLVPLVGRSQAQAEELQAQLKERTHPLAGLTFMSASMNYDLSQHPLDELFPDIIDKLKGSRGRFEVVIRDARERGLSLAQVAQNYAANRSHNLLVGTAEHIADHMQQWLEEGACDGFNLMPAYMPAGLDDFLERVVPELQRRGLFRSQYSGSTLRENLGLALPA
ncbi:LLM class flavin-dependent oxidoreductase [Pseudomonas sp. 5P_3.1_Bac2]|uniref:LLM class flavin-dependent oxidoreductase n=1 Tax=Pseudomonas sp. 5P_3.1_Bac2 TaxID=2971617 RepID=UPI0021C7BE68|nr:LLM class flavin-dependent oxidoreductase [Pseudomonas sp. 5P_3.1_Bac2]MCU1716848.1 LLM class flavin-dependent oxidoreductase [Pseudomonas sp. 5P_3.1_Bac2]